MKVANKCFCFTWNLKWIVVNIFAVCPSKVLWWLFIMFQATLRYLRRNNVLRACYVGIAKIEKILYKSKQKCVLFMVIAQLPRYLDVIIMPMLSAHEMTMLQVGSWRRLAADITYGKLPLKATCENDINKLIVEEMARPNRQVGERGEYDRSVHSMLAVPHPTRRHILLTAKL